MEALVNSRILRYSENEDLYEIAHDSLAQRIAEKRDDEEIALLEIRRLIKGQLSLNEDARSLFSDNQLEFMSPFLQKTALTEEEQGFIDRSRAKVAADKAEQERVRQRELADAARIKKNLRLAIVAALFAGILAIGAGYFYLGAHEKEGLAKQSAAKAEQSAIIAKEEQKKAEKALDDVLQEKIRQQLSSIQTLKSLGQNNLVQPKVKDAVLLIKELRNKELAKGFLNNLLEVVPENLKDLLNSELKRLETSAKK